MRGLVKGVAALALLAQGCAAVPVQPESPPGLGKLTSRKGRPGVVIGAPHGTTDAETGRISLDLARRTGFGLVVATGYGGLDGRRRRLNVNRPTEGVPGGLPAEEVYTEDARVVYEAYVNRVREVAQGPLSLYVEIHGNARQESAGRIEIATVGVSRQDAWRLRTLLELIRDAHLGGKPGIPRLDVLVEPLDRLYWTASAVKQVGILKLPERAIHVELPRVVRTLGREAYTDVLADFLTEATRLLLAREP